MSEQYRVIITFQGIDQLSNTAKKADESLKQLGNNGEAAKKKMSEFDKVLSNLKFTIIGVTTAMATFRVIESITEAITYSIRAFREYEFIITRAAALTRESTVSFEDWSRAVGVVASGAAVRFGYSGAEAAAGLEALLKAGVRSQDALHALVPTMAMARIEGTSLTEAARNLAMILAQFGIEGREAARAVDVLVNAAAAGIGTATDFAKGLGNVASTARMAGLSIEETAALLVILERNFGTADEAGTHLNRLLLSLHEVALKLNIPIREANGQYRAMRDILFDVINVVRNSNMSFGELEERLVGVEMRAKKALFILATAPVTFDEIYEQVTRSGTAMETFGKIMDTAAGKAAQLEARIDVLARQVGKSFSDIELFVKEKLYGSLLMFIALFEGAAGVVTRNTEVMVSAFLKAALAWGASIEDLEKILRIFYKSQILTREETLRLAQSLGITSEWLTQMAMGAEDASGKILVFKDSVHDAAKATQELNINIEESTKLIDRLASKYGLETQRVREVIEAVSGLKIPYIENLELRESLIKTFDIEVSKAEEIIRRLEQESQAARQSAEAIREAERAMREKEQAVSGLIRALMGLEQAGMVMGPLASNINAVTKAMDDLITVGGKVPPTFSDIINKAMELNNKFVELERGQKGLGVASGLASLGMEVLNAQLSIQRGLIADELALIDEEIAKRRDQLQELRLMRQAGMITKEFYQQQEDALLREIYALEERKERLTSNIRLTAEQAATMTRLMGIQDALGIATQQLSLMQMGLELAMMGAKDTGESFINVSLSLADAMMDGVITSEEYKDILGKLGVTFDESGRPVMNFKSFLEKFRAEVETNIAKVNELRNAIIELRKLLSEEVTAPRTVTYYEVEMGATTTTTAPPAAQPAEAPARPPPPPSKYEKLQRGAWFTYEGLYYLHRGEMVLPAEVAELVRRGRTRNVVVNINISGVGMDAQKIADIVSRRIVRRLRVM